MIKIEFEFQTPEEATLAIQAVTASQQNKNSTYPTPAQPQQPAAPVPVAEAPAPPAQPTPATPAPTPPPTTAVPVAAAPTYTREQIMTAGAALIDAGKMNELMTLLNSFNVQAVTQLKPDQLGTFATELRKLGAQI